MLFDPGDFFCRHYELAGPPVGHQEWWESPWFIRGLYDEDILRMISAAQSGEVYEALKQVWKSRAKSVDLTLPPIRRSRLRVQLRRFGPRVCTFAIVRPGGAALVGVTSTVADARDEKAGLRFAGKLLDEHYGRLYGRNFSSGAAKLRPFEQEGFTYFSPEIDENVHVDHMVGLLAVAQSLRFLRQKK